MKKKHFNKPKSDMQEERGKYIGIVEYCVLTRTNVHIENIFTVARTYDAKWALLKNYYSMYIFTISKMKRQLGF